MEYNTNKEKLILPEYGRNVQKLVKHAISIEDKTERNKFAAGIISIMGNMNPHLRDISEFKHKLWDHLAIMSEFKLDIDAPYPSLQIETLNEAPKKVPYKNNNIKYKHYGTTLERLINAAVIMEEGEEKEALIAIIADHMKKSYLNWNKESVNNDKIFSDLKELSKGKISLNEENTKLRETRDILSKKRKKKTIRKK
ncbi:MAG: DUF4290 domain-containing protein [Bacteroidales bacterium]|jgi:hypothetical protein|nr:DUF4290 domain-containing protein [Bacteroidales bacterium]